MELTFSVVLCAYTDRRWDDLCRAVESVRQQTVAAQQIIVVIDHNPALLSRVQAHMPDVIAIENSAARGLSGARNSGIAAAHGAIVAFLDDDALASPDWLAQLQAVYADPNVAGVGGKIEPRWIAQRPAWFPAEFNWVVGCTYQGMAETPAPVRNLIGCNMSFRRHFFASTGGFRIGRVGQLSIGQEDDETEFCIRLTSTHPDAAIIYQPAAQVQHTVSPGRGSLSYFARRCYSEGLSKAMLSRLVGSNRGLSTERTYTFRTLPQGVLRGIGDALLRRDMSGLLRSIAIIIGLAITATGYIIGHLYQRIWRITHTSQPAPDHHHQPPDAQTETAVLQQARIDL